MPPWGLLLTGLIGCPRLVPVYALHCLKMWGWTQAGPTKAGPKLAGQVSEAGLCCCLGRRYFRGSRSRVTLPEKLTAPRDPPRYRPFVRPCCCFSTCPGRAGGCSGPQQAAASRPGTWSRDRYSCADTLTGHLQARSHRSLQDLWGRLCPFIFTMMNVLRIQSQDTHIHPAQAPAPHPQGSACCRIPPPQTRTQG